MYGYIPVNNRVRSVFERRHHRFIANVLSKIDDPSARYEIASIFCRELKFDSSTFDEKRFFYAAGLGDLHDVITVMGGGK